MYYFLSGSLDLLTKKKTQKYLVLFFSCLILALITGFRSYNWPDTPIYIDVFKLVPNIFNFSKVEILPFGKYEIKEPIYIHLCSIIKVFTNDTRVFLLIISTISCFLLYKFLTKYSILPIIGFCVYIARFAILRNFMQIRAALAILIAIFSIKYIHEKKLIWFILIIISASLIHYSIIILLPLYWLANIDISFRQTISILGIAFVIGIIFNISISMILANITQSIGIGESYTGGTSEFTVGLGLKNPMIYYQCSLLLLSTYILNNNKKKNSYTLIIKNCYLYSTLILIILSSLLVLSGRLSTICATFEICLIPLIIDGSKKNKLIFFFVFGCILGLFFYSNINKAVNML